jgi:hypothetical protein
MVALIFNIFLVKNTIFIVPSRVNINSDKFHGKNFYARKLQSIIYLK